MKLKRKHQLRKHNDRIPAVNTASISLALSPTLCAHDNYQWSEEQTKLTSLVALPDPDDLMMWHKSGGPNSRKEANVSVLEMRDSPRSTSKNSGTSVKVAPVSLLLRHRFKKMGWVLLVIELGWINLHRWCMISSDWGIELMTFGNRRGSWRTRGVEAIDDFWRGYAQLLAIEIFGSPSGLKGRVRNCDRIFNKLTRDQQNVH